MHKQSIQGLTFIQPLVWNDVLALWRTGEEELEHWITLWKEKGFSSWEEWRQQYIGQLALNEIENWHLYTINDPLQSIPSFRGGPYSSWRERHYQDGKFATFREIVQHPFIKEHEKINAISKDFPEETRFIGLLTEQGILIIEGMHRCCALTLALERGEKIKTNATIALAEASAKELWDKIKPQKEKK